jgi:hypothetical protein
MVENRYQWWRIGISGGEYGPMVENMDKWWRIGTSGGG